jgi:hypothetical protein
VRKNLIFAKGEIRFLRELARTKVDFMIVGLSAAALQGAPVVTQDVDLWFRDLDDPRIRKALRKVGAVFVPPMEDDPPVFAGNAVELFDIVTHMHGLGSFEEERRHAVRIPLGGFRLAVLPLERIIASKRTLGRPKDKLVLPVLADVQRTVKARSAKKRSFTAGAA